MPLLMVFKKCRHPSVAPWVLAQSWRWRSLILVLCAKLTTEVNRSGLIQYFPFHLSPQRIPLEHVIQIEIKTYKPLRIWRLWNTVPALGAKAPDVGAGTGKSISNSLLDEIF